MILQGKDFYYQVNATFFSALGEERASYFARAIHVYAWNTSSLVFRYFCGKIIMKQLITVVVQVIRKLTGNVNHADIEQGLKQMLYRSS
jgi:hypothetical protein